MRCNMKKLKIWGFIILIFFLFLICAKEVHISIITEKSEFNAKIGEKGTLSFKVTDPDGNVEIITGVVREYPEFVFEFGDNGESGDEKADDGIWSAETEIPSDAPPGKYNINIDFEVYDADG
ncbi:MAG: hypothetical protein HWN67_05695, partial [Candidatus Helarchaeota archaeon]|nr:hypothetical protein [Candidatus Helarchaeota archaeon]